MVRVMEKRGIRWLPTRKHNVCVCVVWSKRGFRFSISFSVSLCSQRITYEYPFLLGDHPPPRITTEQHQHQQQQRKQAQIQRNLCVYMCLCV